MKSLTDKDILHRTSINLKNINFFKVGSGKNITFDIALTGMMLALVIIFQYLEKFMPWLGGMSLKLNLSLIFIFILWIVSGFPWATIVLLIRFVIAPSLGTLSNTSYGWYASFLLLFSEVVFIWVFICFYYVLRLHIKNQYQLITTILIISIFLTTIFLTIMNGLWMTPIFWHLYWLGNGSYKVAHDMYNSGAIPHGLLFGMPSYWSGIFLVFGTGNLVKFAIVSFALFPLIKVIQYVV